MTTSRCCVLGLVLLLVGAGGGCAVSESDDDRPVTLSVFAASSLTESFHELAQAFEAAYPSVDVQLVVAGSQVLRLQIEQGAAADVFASANQAHLIALVESGHIDRHAIFAHNELVLIAPSASPDGIRRFDQLPRASRIVIGSDRVPVGIYARAILDRAETTFGPEFGAAVRERIASEEPNVRLVRAKVELGEADAAFVYRTDAVASTRVRTVSIPEPLRVQASYPVGTLTRSLHPTESRAFVDYVRSPAGRRILERHGFTTGGE
jgi:molybdate transport system substrate-binding protein